MKTEIEKLHAELLAARKLYEDASSFDSWLNKRHTLQELREIQAAYHDAKRRYEEAIQ